MTMAEVIVHVAEVLVIGAIACVFLYFTMKD